MSSSAEPTARARPRRAPRLFPGEPAGLEPGGVGRTHAGWALTLPVPPFLSSVLPSPGQPRVLSAPCPDRLLSLASASVRPSLTVAFPSRQLPCRSGCTPFLLGAWLSALLSPALGRARLPSACDPELDERPLGGLPVGSSLGQRTLL